MVVARDVVFAQEQLHGSLFLTIFEALVHETLRRVDAVRNRSSHATFAGSRKVSLQCAGACVALTHRIGVVCPDVLEHTVEHRIQLNVVACHQDAELCHLLLQDVLGQQTLHNIGAIQTIDTVGANHSMLTDQSGLTAVFQKVALFIKFALHLIEEQGQILVAVVLAFLMKIEREIEHIRIRPQTNLCFVLFAQRMLATLLIDQRHQHLWAIQIQLCLQMSSEHGTTEETRHLNGGLGLECFVELCPQQWDRSTDLYERRDIVQIDHHGLGLNIVCRETQRISSSSIEAGPGSFAFTARNQHIHKVGDLDMALIDRDETINHRNDPSISQAPQC
mmetsp:Transcript_5463/g.16693  ORF Transcript_5463/g.16693 Transcript_5463/m.16693 type:complete len:334 (-) Transcript_5463:1011-2012(-)